MTTYPATPVTRRTLLVTPLTIAFGALSTGVFAQNESPDGFIKRLSNAVLDAIRKDTSIKAGEIGKTIALVDRLIMPHVNFRRMTAAAVGPAWRQATPEQQRRLQEEFKTQLVRTYAGALSQVTDQTIAVKPLRAAAGDKDVLVRTEIVGRGDPVPLDYRLEQTPGEGAGWKIYNLSVFGVWLAGSYRDRFVLEINAKGLDGLIAYLVACNQTGSCAQ